MPPAGRWSRPHHCSWIIGLNDDGHEGSWAGNRRLEPSNGPHDEQVISDAFYFQTPYPSSVMNWNAREPTRSPLCRNLLDRIFRAFRHKLVASAHVHLPTPRKPHWHAASIIVLRLARDNMVRVVDPISRARSRTFAPSA